MTVLDRFLAKVDKTGPGGCWLWTAYVDRHGYGHFRLNGQMPLAHRVAYELFVGPIPPGRQLDHLCRVRHCMNPEHLEPVTNGQNQERGIRASMTYCAYGHPFTPENTYIRKRAGGRYGGRGCRICIARRQREKQQRRKARAA